jgi:hypothetical protein
MRRAGFELTNPDIVDAVHIREVFDTLLDAREGFLFHVFDHSLHVGLSPNLVRVFSATSQEVHLLGRYHARVASAKDGGSYKSWNDWCRPTNNVTRK